MNGRALTALAFVVLALALLLLLQRSHHRSADQRILIEKSHQH